MKRCASARNAVIRLHNKHAVDAKPSPVDVVDLSGIDLDLPSARATHASCRLIASVQHSPQSVGAVELWRLVSNTWHGMAELSRRVQLHLRYITRLNAIVEDGNERISLTRRDR